MTDQDWPGLGGDQPDDDPTTGDVTGDPGPLYAHSASSSDYGPEEEFPSMQSSDGDEPPADIPADEEEGFGDAPYSSEDDPFAASAGTPEPTPTEGDVGRMGGLGGGSYDYTEGFGAAPGGPADELYDAPDDLVGGDEPAAVEGFGAADSGSAADAGSVSAGGAEQAPDTAGGDPLAPGPSSQPPDVAGGDPLATGSPAASAAGEMPAADPFGEPSDVDPAGEYPAYTGGSASVPAEEPGSDPLTGGSAAGEETAGGETAGGETADAETAGEPEAAEGLGAAEAGTPEAGIPEGGIPADDGSGEDGADPAAEGDAPATVEESFGAAPPVGVDPDATDPGPGADWNTFPAELTMDAVPDPVDGPPWIDPDLLGDLDTLSAADLTAGLDPDALAAWTDPTTVPDTPVPTGDLLDYAGEDPGTADPWSVLQRSEDPATAALARWWAPPAA